MIKFTYTTDSDKQNLGLGISRENVNRLTEGRPIRVRLEEMGVSVNGEIMIFFKESDAALHQSIAEFITPETKVHISPKAKAKMT